MTIDPNAYPSAASGTPTPAPMPSIRPLNEAGTLREDSELGERSNSDLLDDLGIKDSVCLMSDCTQNLCVPHVECVKCRDMCPNCSRLGIRW